MNNENIIKLAKLEFEKSFLERNYYNIQTQDDDHLDRIVEAINVSNKKRILDLGTGSGYLGFKIASEFKDSLITGLDIVTQTLKENTNEALKRGISNIDFIDYDGEIFPFKDNTFDIIVTRYAFHHFPDISKSFDEITRVLKPNGYLFISDPTPNDMDTSHFVDEYMGLKKDGHVKFYTENEFKALAEVKGFKFIESFYTSIRFPRKINNDYLEILKKHKKSIINSYYVEVIDEEIYITEQVQNILWKLTNKILKS